MIKLLLSTLLVVQYAMVSSAFMPQTPVTTRTCQLRSTLLPFKTFGDHHEVEHTMVPSKPQIMSLNSPEEFKRFLEEDDERLCTIKFHASWCKSCKAFGKQYERIGKEIGDLVAINDPSTVTRKGEIRLGEIEFGKNAMLCKKLGVKKVPSIFVYYKGTKLDGFPCGPKKIAQTTERLNHFRSLSPTELAFEANMGEGLELGDELLEQLNSQIKDSQKQEDTSHKAEQSNVSNQ